MLSVPTRWEVDNRAEGEVRARFAATEFKKEQFINDLFAFPSGHSTTRLIDSTALKGREVAFVTDVTNAPFHVDETNVSLRAATGRKL